MQRIVISFDRRHVPTYIVVLLVGLAIGFFAGREYLKYEIRSTFSAAAEKLQSDLKGVFSGSAAKPASRSARPEAPARQAEPSPISAVLVKKEFLPSDIESRRYGDYITLGIEFENLTGKDVRAFEGTFTFYDLLDNEILGSRITINDPVKAGAKFNWSGSIDYNQFMNAHQKLRGESQQNLKTIFDVKKILFADGTTKDFS